MIKKLLYVVVIALAFVGLFNTVDFFKNVDKEKLTNLIDPKRLNDVKDSLVKSVEKSIDKIEDELDEDGIFPGVEGEIYEDEPIHQGEGEGESFFNVINVQHNGEVHEYLFYHCNGTIQFSHWAGCKYCKGK